MHKQTAEGELESGQAGAEPEREATRGAQPGLVQRKIQQRALQRKADREAELDAPKDGEEEKKATVKGPEEKKGAAPTKAETPLADDELVLSRDPAYAKPDYLNWFRGQLRTKVEGWGLAFDPATVRLAGAGTDGALVVAVKWNQAWGSSPATRDVPFTLDPIEAQISRKAAHGLKGWAKLDGATQGILDNLLGGESNELSQAARAHLRGQFLGLKAKTEEEQANALKATITAKEAKPGVVAEDVKTTAAKYTLAGPTEKKDYEFRGKKADAEQWEISFADGIKFPIIAPKAPTPGFHNHTVQQTADAASYLPKSARQVITSVVLNAVTNPEDPHWAAKYNTPNFHSYMTAGAAGQVTIYPDAVAKTLPSDSYMRGTMIHETGHTWSKKAWGEDSTKGKWVDWKKAMDADRVAVSGYAANSIGEDVAETVQVYGSTRGTPKFDEYRKLVPQRFGILDKEYK